MYTKRRRSLSLVCAFGTVILWLLLDVPLASNASRYVRPEDCTWEPTPNSAGVSMICTINTLQGEPNPTNFSLIMPGHTVELSIRCTGDRETSPKSEISNHSFMHLGDLQSLTIERCKIDHLTASAFRGLSHLKHLTLRTYHFDWAGRTSLTIPPSALVPLQDLETIELSENNAKQLSPGLFCGLNKLRFVNLTGNSIEDEMSLGFSQKHVCRLTLRELEITRNKLKALQDRSFSALAHLEELRVSHNEIATVEPSALEGLGKLERLDIAHNMLVALPAGFLQPTPNISELYLRNNTLSALPPNIFANVTQLTILDLAHNQLSSLEWLKIGSMADLAHLDVLDLAHNRLTRLDTDEFGAVKSLQTLQIRSNHIDFIGERAFAALSNLQSLVLSHNRLKSIESNALAGLDSLMTLQLDHNRIEVIYDNAFEHMPLLQELNLAGNKLTAVPHAVSSLSMLRSLDLSGNAITDIVNTSYQGLERLYALNLMGNAVGNISQGAFRHLPSVRIVNLARNSIQVIEQGTFDDVPGLHYLRLDSNAIDDVNGLFRNLHDLIMLNISVNRLRWFDYALIPVGLQWLDIHDNQIEALGNYFELEQSLKLRTLDASYNNVSDLDSTSLPNSVEIVFLKHNKLKRIQPFTFLGKHNLSRVDLTDNDLETLEMSTFRLGGVSVRRPLPEFAIANNPYLCNCHMQWLQSLQTSPIDVTSNQALRQFPRIVDLHTTQCRLMFSKKIRQVPLIMMKPSQFLCQYQSHCFPLCHCCEFEECDCEVVCPENCTCYRDQSWTTHIIDCGSRHHFDSPRRLPTEATEVYLDGNDISTVAPPSFNRCRMMHALFLNGSNIKSIQNQTFEGLDNLSVLQLENNQISALQGHEFAGLLNLRALYLSKNKIKYVQNTTFTLLKNLEILHLDRNRLVEFSVWSLRSNPRMSNIRLARNPWTCNCYFTPNLVQYVHEHSDMVRDIHNMSCIYNKTTTLRLWDFNLTRCNSPSQATLLIHQSREVNGFVPVIAILGTLVVTVTVFLAVIVAVYRRHVRLWFFSRYGVRMFQRPPVVEEEKLFDAFVSYTKEDGAFVVQMLAPELESCNPPYRLCLHYRDLPIADSYLSEAIEEAVDSSRRTIVILSEHFLRNEWSRYEFKFAHDEVLNNKNHKLVVILLGRVSYRDLHSEIRAWLKHSTILHWGEQNFWEKLRFAMPDTRYRKTVRADVTSVTVHI